MYEFLLIGIFQLCAAFVLVRLVGFLGSHTQKMGYTNFSNIEQEGDLGYNLMLRILAPSVYITFLSIGLYLINTSILIMGIWLIAVWYAVFSFIISLFLGRFVLVNKIQYFFVHLLAIIIAYWFYSASLSQGIEFILPDGTNFRTELWIILILFFYAVISNYQLDYSKHDKRKKKYIQTRYKVLHSRYFELLNGRFHKDVFLEKTFFSIMILEDLNRNQLVRFLERVLYPLGFVKTTGIMQVSSSEKLSDIDSVKIAQDKIEHLYLEHVDKTTHNYDLVRKIAGGYNPDEEYIDGVINIFGKLEGDQSILFRTRTNNNEDELEQDTIFPNLKDIKDYKDVLDFLEKLSSLLKKEVQHEKNKLDRTKKMK